MSFSEQGVYREMLDQQWEDLTLPDDAQAVADLIANTPAKVTEVLAAWPVVRRQFVSEADGRIFNVRLERARADRQRFIKTSKKGGRARAKQAMRNASGAFQPAASQSPADSQPDTSRVAPAENQPPIQATARSSTASASASSSATAPAVYERAHATAGMLPRDHRTHVFCGRKCVPEFIHAEFIGSLGGDPDDAAGILLGKTGGAPGWYSRVEAGLPPGPIGDDPPKFWRAHFAASFPSGAPKLKDVQPTYQEPWDCPHVTQCSGRSMCANAKILGRPEKAKASA